MKFLKAEYLFLISATGLILMGLLPVVKTFDINMHDTYFVIAGRHFLYFLSMFLFLIALVYFIFSKLSKPLDFTIGLVHFVLTILFFFSFWNIADIPYSHDSSNSFVRSGIILYVTAALFAIAQIFFIGNIIWSLLKSKVSKP